MKRPTAERLTVKRPTASIAVALVGALAVTAGCGVAQDETAATVYGKTVSTSEVAKLAGTTFVSDYAQQQNVGLVSSPKGTVGSAKQRVALSIILQTQVLEKEVTLRKGSITAADRADAAQQVAQIEQQTAQSGASGALDSSVRSLLVRYTSAQSALVRMAGGLTTDPATDAELQAYFDAHPEQYGVQTCLDGFAVSSEKAASVKARVDGGATAADVLGDSALQAQPLSQSGGETCVPVGQVTEAVRQVVDEGPVGVWSTVEINDPSAGMITLFVHPNSREQVSIATPSVRDEITAAVEQEKQTKRRSEVLAKIEKAFKNADVTVDSRYGTWDPKGQTVEPPPAPVASARDAATSAATGPLAGA